MSERAVPLSILAVVLTQALPSDFVAEVLDGIADLPASLAERFLNGASALFGLALVSHPFIVLEIANRFLDASFHLIRFATHLVFIPHEFASSGSSTYSVQESYPDREVRSSRASRRIVS